MIQDVLHDLVNDPIYREITQRLLIALLFGGLIGLERSYHGRPAGFRTHALVCLSTSLLMLVSAFAGYDTTMAAYRHAVHHRYRFYSYGDAMLVV